MSYCRPNKELIHALFDYWLDILSGSVTMQQSCQNLTLLESGRLEQKKIPRRKIIIVRMSQQITWRIQCNFRYKATSLTPYSDVLHHANSKALYLQGRSQINLKRIFCSGIQGWFGVIFHSIGVQASLYMGLLQDA